jgi:hypothetical protein
MDLEDNIERILAMYADLRAEPDEELFFDKLERLLSTVEDYLADCEIALDSEGK